MTRALLIMALLAAACSHDATRENPLDPSLTPPVELTVTEADSVYGNRLTWTPYAGASEFASYEILRQRGSEVPELISSITDVAVTEHIDTTAVQGIDYSYSLAVRNAAGLLTGSESAGAGGLQLPGVRIQSVTAEAATASASIEWEAYSGPRFSHYLVQRTRQDEIVTVGIVSNRDSTRFEDKGLLAGAAYGYRIDVITEQDEATTGSSAFMEPLHRLIAQWPIEDVAGGSARLYWENGGLDVLISTENTVRVQRYSPGGLLLDEEVYLDHPMLNVPHRSVSLGRTRGQGAVLSMVDRTWALRIQFVDGLAVLDSIVTTDRALESPASQVLDDAILQYSTSLAGEGEGNFAILSEGDTLKSWENPRTPFVEGLRVNTQDFGLRVRSRIARGQAWFQVRIGPDSTAFFTGLLTSGRQDIGFHTWLPETVNEQLPHPIVDGLRYGLGADYKDGHLTGWFKTPISWHTSLENPGPLSCQLSTEAGIAHSAGGALRFFASTDEPRQANIDYAVSEMRAWENDGHTWMGVCSPDLGQIRMRDDVLSSDRIQIVEFNDLLYSGVTIGNGVGTDDGLFLFPISFDAGPDGRIYVLDAGNRRIQSFDADGTYITHWGSEGSGPGQFDFGSGGAPEDFAGSVAVDDDGFIYVADVGNRRIQVFAP